MAAYYSVTGNQTSHPLSWTELEALGFTRTGLNVAFGRGLPSLAEPLTIEPVRLVATILRRFQVEPSNGQELILDGNRLRFNPNAS